MSRGRHLLWSSHYSPKYPMSRDRHPRYSSLYPMPRYRHRLWSPHHSPSFPMSCDRHRIWSPYHSPSFPTSCDRHRIWSHHSPLFPMSCDRHRLIPDVLWQTHYSPHPYIQCPVIDIVFDTHVTQFYIHVPASIIAIPGLSSSHPVLLSLPLTNGKLITSIIQCLLLTLYDLQICTTTQDDRVHLPTSLIYRHNLNRVAYKFATHPVTIHYNESNVLSCPVLMIRS